MYCLIIFCRGGFQMKKDYIKRIIMTALGVVVLAIGAGALRSSRMGIDPYQSFTLAIDSISPLDYGTTYVIINVVSLILMLIFARKYIGVGTFINLFLLGYIIEFSSLTIDKYLPVDNIWMRIILLCLAIILICLSSAFIFTANLGVSTYDWIALTLGERENKLSFKWWRIITDTSCVIIGLIFSIKPGIGTIISAFALGPIIAFFRKYVSEPIMASNRTGRI